MAPTGRYWVRYAPLTGVIIGDSSAYQGPIIQSVGSQDRLRRTVGEIYWEVTNPVSAWENIIGVQGLLVYVWAVTDSTAPLPTLPAFGGGPGIDETDIVHDEWMPGEILRRDSGGVPTFRFPSGGGAMKFDTPTQRLPTGTGGIYILIGWRFQNFEAFDAGTRVDISVNMQALFETP